MNVNHVPGIVRGTTSVEIPITKEESQQLRQALAIIDKYKNTAFNSFKEKLGYRPPESDWHSVSYAVKSDKVLVIIQDGMAG